MRAYGWKKDKPDRRDFLYKIDRRLTILDKVDLRQFDSPIYDQESLGSCTGNAIAGNVEYLFRQTPHPDYTPSRLMIYWLERKLEGSIREDAGAEIRDGIKAMVRWGACPEAMWPYNISKFTRRPPCKCFREAKKDIIQKYEKLIGIDQYKASLSEGYPFVFGFLVYESFESTIVSNTGIVPMPNPREAILGGHAVMAIGYDDSKQWFIIRNSWGKWWGDKGYFYLPYNYFTPDLTDDFWVIYSVL